MRVLVTAASRYGSTAEIAEVIGEELGARGLAVSVIGADELPTLSGFDAVVLGSAVYMGHWLPPAIQLAERLPMERGGQAVWLFSSGPVGNPARKLVQQMGADPVDVPGLKAATHARDHRMFAGKLDRKNLRGLRRASLRVFPGIVGDFRNWDDIRAWAGTIADQLLAATAA